MRKMKVRFFQCALVVCIFAIILVLCTSSEQEERRKKLEENGLILHEEEVSISGLTEPFEFTFLADTHISLCDDRDKELLEKSSERYQGFCSDDGESADVTFVKLMDYIKWEQPQLMILGGDIIDSAMWASIDFVDEILQQTGISWMYGMGNHDFEYGKEYFSKKAYAEYLPRLKNISTTEKGYQIVEYDEFIIFLADDKNNQIKKAAVKAFEKVVNDGRSIILVLHVPIEPIVENTLLEESKAVWGVSEENHSRVLMGINSCVPNKNTQRFLDLVLMEDSPVELVLAGHIHFYHKDNLTNDLVQIVTGAGYKKELLKVTLKPEK